ncbi:transposase [Chryseobacterium sp. MIQD13]|uniref:transposase n=1 Tax=Chryseobacterium sp. MIQD13 TaxID=3422310 RepID=UPI003D26DC88
MGSIIYHRIIESEIEISRVCNFMKYTEEEIKAVCGAKSVDSEVLLKLSKILGYDFFRVYTQHLILFAPSAGKCKPGSGKEKTEMPQFRKNIYTKEVVNYILELLETGEKTKKEIVNEYNIPKTTLYKWIKKYEYEHSA